MLPTVSNELDKILEIIDHQTNNAQKLHEIRTKIDVLNKQIEKTRKELNGFFRKIAKDDQLDVSVARLKLAEAESEIIRIYQIRHESGVGSERAKAAAKKEIRLESEADLHRKVIDRADWVRSELSIAEAECRKALEIAQSNLKTLGEESNEIIENSRENEKSIDVATQKLQSMFASFDEIRSQAESISNKLGLEACSEEVTEWAHVVLPSFDENLRAIKRSLDDLRLRGITRSAPLKLLLASYKVKYEDLEKFLLKQVPVFTSDLCRSFLFHLSDECIRQLCRAMK